MTRIIIGLIALGWLAAGSAHASGLAPSNIAPLAFGMTPEEAATVLGTRLVYVSGRPGSEVFLAERDAGVPGFYPVNFRIFLQFRRGALTGWKKDWAVTRPYWLF
jgi:hypothetical protein